MSYIPIFAKDLSKYLGKPVVIIGKVIEIIEKEKYIDYIVLDPTDYTTLRSFEKERFNIFSTLLALGVVKEFKGKIYVAIRFAYELDEDEELLWRYLHLIHYPKRANIPKVQKKRVDLDLEEVRDLRKAVLLAIEKLDKGEGVSIEELQKVLNASKKDLERIIEELLALGEIYEASLGKLKILK